MKEQEIKVEQKEIKDKCSFCQYGPASRKFESWRVGLVLGYCSGRCRQVDSIQLTGFQRAEYLKAARNGWKEYDIS